MAFNTAAFAEKLRKVDASQPAVTGISKYIQYQATVSAGGAHHLRVWHASAGCCSRGAHATPPH